MGHTISKHIPAIWIKRTFTAAIKEMGFQKGRARRPLTPTSLHKIKLKLDFSKHDDRALWAILGVGLFSLTRIGELVLDQSSPLK